VRRPRPALLAFGAVAVAAGLWLAAGERAPAPTGAWMLRAGVTPHLAEADGLHVRYVRRGSGPPVLLVHGIASSIYTWADVIPALAVRHDVIALDLPGFGASDIPAGFSGDRYPRVLASFLDHLGLPRVSLVGHSLGGAASAAFAAAHPERVAKLALVDAAGFNLAPSDRPWLLRLAGAPGAGAVMEALPVRRRLIALGLRQVFHDDARVTPEKVEEYAAPMARPGAQRFMSELLRGAGSMGLPEAITRVRAPTLVVWCSDDQWVPLRDADRFVQAIPGARKAVIEGCGHLPQEERPRELLALLEQFL
jgi:4,5:9,10-diseco-3-hydroxy-5,9,17-trioxoandrosta-1(10),2-diene-4-oate hydrolase